jgi:hypothetical protein
MSYPQDQIDQLKAISPLLSTAEEGGITYIVFESLSLPENCTPSTVRALLCPVPRDGYQSRLYFSVMPGGCPALNWNGNIRVLGETWYAFSWLTAPNLRLSEMLLMHLKPLRNEKK